MTKGPDAFRTISEAAAEVGVAQHVLKFWETKFSFIRPMKRAGGRRFYRPQDLTVLRGVRRLLHDEGYTIAGVQKLHRDQGTARLVAAASGAAPAKTDGANGAGSPAQTPAAGSNGRAGLTAVLRLLEDAKARLDRALED